MGCRTARRRTAAWRRGHEGQPASLPTARIAVRRGAGGARSLSRQAGGAVSKRLLCAPACQGTTACRSWTPPSSPQVAGHHPLEPRPAQPRSHEPRLAQPARMHRSPATADAHQTRARLALQRRARHAAMRAWPREQRVAKRQLQQMLRTWGVTEDARELTPRSARATLAQRRSRCIL